MKITTSIRLEEGLVNYAKGKGNVSRYVAGLIKQDIAKEDGEALTESIKRKLLASETFIQELRNRLEGKTVEAPPCCQQVTRCKHWVWDEKSGEGYINTLTGEVR